MRCCGNAMRTISFALCFIVAACASDLTNSKDPDLIGIVTSISASETAVSLLVEQIAHPASYSRVDLYIKRHGSTAAILIERPDGSRQPCSLSCIEVGAEIRAWSNGTELRSDPPQWQALQVLIPAPTK
jgi:hypothetical protein